MIGDRQRVRDKGLGKETVREGGRERREKDRELDNVVENG